MTYASAPPLTLRPLVPADASALQAVYESAPDHFQQAAGSPPPPGQAAFDLAEAAGDDSRYLLGIYLEDTLIGVIDFRLAEPEPYDVRLGLILLATPYQRQGLGSLVLRILEAWLLYDTPSEAVVVAVFAQDHAAQGFFRHHGYTFTGQAIRAQTGETRSRLLFMRKPLTPLAGS